MKKIFIILIFFVLNLSIQTFANTTYDKSIKLGDKAFDNKNFDKALSHYSYAIKLEPKKANAYINRSIVYSFKDEHSNAIDDLTLAIKYAPNNQYAYNNRALEYLTTNKYKKAIRDFTKAIKINPKDADYYANRALCYFYINNKKLAKEDFDKAFSIDKNNEIAIMNFARTLELSHRYKETIEVYSYPANKCHNRNAKIYMERCKDKLILQEMGYNNIWIDYIYETQTKILSNWKPPFSKESYFAIAYITVDPNGTLLNIDLSKNTNTNKGDEAIIKAIFSSTPFYEIPHGLKKKNITMIIPFYYKNSK